MIGARKESAFRPKHHCSPNFANACPASAGPIVTPVLNWIEFSAMAFGMSSLLTKLGISAWYAGPPKACAKPEMNERQSICHTCIPAVATSTVSAGAQAICTYWEPRRIFRRSARSATTPPISEKRKMGMPPRN